MLNPNISKIPAPRTPVLDGDTNLLTPAWYRYLYNLFVLTGNGGNPTSLDELQIGPPTLTVDEIINAINKTIDSLTPVAGTSELQAQLDIVKQELQTLPRQELGTMAALQQDNVPWLKFDTTPSGYPTGPLANGTVYWDDADSIKSLNIVMEDSGEVVQHIGEETYYRVKASSAITNGQVVMFTGTVGASGGLLGAPATGLTATQNEYIMGVATQNIALNGWGYITWFGEVKKVNTTGGAETWADGQILYYNPAVPGGLTKFVPVAPNPKVIVASVVHADTNGILFVRPTFGSALGATDSNVQITSLANADLLQYIGANSRWENTPASTLLVGTATNLAGGSAGAVPYQTAPSTTAFRSIGTAEQIFRVNAGATAPEWVSPAALTKTDDTNVTLTLGGSPTTSLLAATSLTLGWTGQLSVTRGGTGLASLTAGYIPFGNGTSAFGSNADLFWDDTNVRLGVGTVTPIRKIHSAITSTQAYSTTSTIDGDGISIRAQNLNNTANTFAGIDLQAGSSFSSAARISVINDAGTANADSTLTFAVRDSSTSVIERLRITSVGNVGIGTPTPRNAGAGYQVLALDGTNSGILDINTNATRVLSVYGSNTNDANFVNPTVAGNLRFYTNATERLRITSNGGVSFGSSGTAYGTTGQTLISQGDVPPIWGTLSAAAGGTGQTSYAVGDLLYANTTTSLAKLADVATGNALISGGVGVAPSWGKIGLTTHVTGTLGTENGGTGLTALGTGVQTWLGTPSSANLAAAVTDETGSGSLVFATQPSFPSTIGVGGATAAASGAGISFPATQSASSNPNTLDDYEEGTYTPTIVGGTSAGVGTYTVQVGRYTKIGNIVTVSGRVVWTTHTGTGVMRLTLPFTAVNTANYFPSGGINYSNLLVGAGKQLAITVNTNAAHCSFDACDPSGGARANVAIDTAADIMFTVVYEVA